MGVVSVSSETAFGQPPEKVYGFVTDPRNWAKVYPGSSHIVGVERLPLQIGDTWDEGDAPNTFTWRLITAVPHSRWVFQSVGLLGHDPAASGSGFEGLMTISYTFSTPGPGVTLFHRRMNLEMPKRAAMPQGMIRVFEPHLIDAYHDNVAAALSAAG